MCHASHQLSLVGQDYDSKATRLEQILERLPVGGASGVLIIADPASRSTVEDCVMRHENQALAQGEGQALIDVLFGRCPPLPEGPTMFGLVINYDAPTSGAEYLRRVDVAAEAAGSGCGPAVVYTMAQERQLKARGLAEVHHLLQKAKRLATSDRVVGGPAKVAEILSALQYFSAEEEYDEEEEDEELEEEGCASSGHKNGCDCTMCQGRIQSSVSYHASRACRSLSAATPAIQVVRLPLQALDKMSQLEPLIACHLQNHACTVICLHNMYCHTPWDGYEHLFALPAGMGTVRVVMVLATECSWHEYPDWGSFSGGCAWMDMLDMDTMNVSDKLVERLVEHEVGLLHGCSERVVLMGTSQGGGQSLLRFLRSQRRLGGWLGSVCHVPTLPHCPRDRDPLAEPGRAHCNQERPVRVLVGERDSTFPASMVLRDVERLQKVGGFQDVVATVYPGLTHEGPDSGDPVDLLFLREHLPSMIAGIAGPKEEFAETQ